ncbi:MAG TPA: acetyl-CoA C-acyltransferase [Acidimicrobiia bacterium]|nr:acetyl-CoA C-acyltransferase [Acidimicrobiia bacterium]
MRGEPVYLCDGVRTPRGKASPAGGLAGITPLELTTAILRALADRAGLDPTAVDDIVLGVATQTGLQGGNLAKTAALTAGWPATVPGVTINRFCASGVDAVNHAAALIGSGAADLVVAGGVESVSGVPMFSDAGPLWSDPEVAEATGFIHMGVAADLVATLEGFERQELDEYGVRTHRRAAAAWAEGRFDPSLVTVPGPNGTLATDEHIRPDVSLEQAASLDPAFADLGANGMDARALARYPELGAIQHLHHRGSSPSLADGAAALIVASAAAVENHGLRPRARIVSFATAAVDPTIMLTSGQKATLRALDAAGLGPDDIERFEFAEAFAALCLKFQADLGVDSERFNPNGGTIAMGHAFGATGAILMVCLLDELERSGTRRGMVAVSGAAGLGVATAVELL